MAILFFCTLTVISVFAQQSMGGEPEVRIMVRPAQIISVDLVKSSLVVELETGGQITVPILPQTKIGKDENTVMPLTALSPGMAVNLYYLSDPKGNLKQLVGIKVR
jgi:hypothetical protein